MIRYLLYFKAGKTNYLIDRESGNLVFKTTKFVRVMYYLYDQGSKLKVINYRQMCDQND